LVLSDPNGLDWGSFDLGNGRASFHWFKGKAGEYKGRKYNPVDFGNSATKILKLVGGSRVQISRNNDIANPVSSKAATSQKPQSEGVANPNLANAIADRTESIPVTTGGFAVVAAVAGVTAGAAVATAPALAAESLTSLGIESAALDTAVIGSEVNTAAYVGQTGFNVLRVADYSWKGANLPWLHSVVKTGQSVIVLGGNLYTQREAGWLQDAAQYVWNAGGDKLIPH